MKQILFIMPFGTKTFPNKKSQGTITIDFDEKYNELCDNIKNLKLDFNVNRVDNIVGTDIYRNMYKSINAADIVLADLTSLNPNVMYELGARHALRDKKTILFWQNEIDDKIPFDINTFKIWTIENLLEDFENIIKNKDADSPIKKEIDTNYRIDKKIFQDYTNIWDKFETEYKACESTDFKNRNIILEKYKKYFKGIEEFDQKYALNYYKLKNDLIGLQETLKIIKKYNPHISSDHETIGLACTISRKIYEITKNKNDWMTAYNYSRHFISIYKTAYSFSSYALNLMANIEIENNHNKKIYYKEEFKILLEDWNNHCDSSSEPNYFEHSKNLINILNGIETDYYKKNKIDSFEFKTSKESYDRASKLWYDFLQ